MKVLILSRLQNPNIGHTLMDDGMIRVLRHMFGSELVVDRVEQHHPLVSLYDSKNPIRAMDRLPDHPWYYNKTVGRIKSLLTYDPAINYMARFLRPELKDYDLAIAVGGPSLIGGMSQTVQTRMLMLHLHGVLKLSGIPVVNAGLGSCYPYRNVPRVIPGRSDRNCAAAYIRHSTTTVVRDRVAQNLYKQTFGLELPLLGCPTFLALDEHQEGQAARSRRQIVINYMRYWPLSEPAQAIRVEPDISGWDAAIADIVRTHAGNYEIVFSCHSPDEEQIARERFPGYRIVRPQSAADYARLAAGTVACIAGRIHCAIPMQSAGVPSLAVGSDTRMMTCEHLGIPIADVESITPEWLTRRLSSMIAEGSAGRPRALAIKADLLNSYVAVLKDAIRGSSSRTSAHRPAHAAGRGSHESGAGSAPHP